MPNSSFAQAARLVLVVDDDTTTCALAQAYLQLEGFRVRTADNGVEALAVLRACAPAVMVVDLRMPVMDAIEFRERQLAMTGLADVPFVLMSASAQLETAAATLRASATLTKPFSNEDLKAVIDYVCEQHDPG